MKRIKTLKANSVIEVIKAQLPQDLLESDLRLLYLSLNQHIIISGTIAPINIDAEKLSISKLQGCLT